ncbi:hypothetical protein JW872_01010 [Candidatus Babeliales bacterium]|nr:hypothetical protein [Candidatus Babeliales bacterium]
MINKTSGVFALALVFSVFLVKADVVLRVQRLGQAVLLGGYREMTEVKSICALIEAVEQDELRKYIDTMFPQCEISGSPMLCTKQWDRLVALVNRWFSDPNAAFTDAFFVKMRKQAAPARADSSAIQKGDGSESELSDPGDWQPQDDPDVLFDHDIDCLV